MLVKHKKRINWFFVLVVDLDRLLKQDKDFQSSETEPIQPGLEVGCPVVTYKVGTSSALELVSSALFSWWSGPGCDFSYLK